MVKNPGRLVEIDVVDLRFPTSRNLDGSDAMHPDPDYSAAYVVLRTDIDDGLEGHGFAFTLGRGNEICVQAIRSLWPLLKGLVVDEVLADLGTVTRRLTSDSQLRWLGPEKGVMALATAALVNALWDLRAKRAGLPLWKLLCGLSPEALVAEVDWRYLSDALTPDQALDLLRVRVPGKAAQEARLMESGLPAYTTSAGWLGYSDETVRAHARDAVRDGFTHLKVKVGADLDDDIRRCAAVRQEIGPDRRLMIDANQRWDVGQAVEWIGHLAQFDLHWVEEPTSPDDVLGLRAIREAVHPIGIAGGEHVQNRVVFKQLLAGSALDFCQIDACRVAGVGENIAILLLAARYGIPVCPHAGGVGLCEMVVHLAAFDAIAVRGEDPDRVVEYVDHLHEHFLDPVVVARGNYRLPDRPGYSTEIRPETLSRFRFPDGAYWAEDRGVSGQPGAATTADADLEGAPT